MSVLSAYNVNNVIILQVISISAVCVLSWLLWACATLAHSLTHTHNTLKHCLPSLAIKGKINTLFILTERWQPLEMLMIIIEREGGREEGGREEGGREGGREEGREGGREGGGRGRGRKGGGREGGREGGRGMSDHLT